MKRLTSQTPSKKTAPIKANAPVRALRSVRPKTKAANQIVELTDAALYRNLFLYAPDIVLLLEKDGTLADASAAVQQVWGLLRESIIGKNIADFALRSDIEKFMKIFQSKRRKSGGEPQEFLWEIGLPRGIVKYLRVRQTLVHQDGTLYAVAILRDVTVNIELQKSLRAKNEELLQLNEQLKGLAKHDQLTGVFNRRHFEEVFDYELARANRYRFNISVAMVDIDDFKDVNDTYGHQVGDEVLRMVAQQMRDAVRKSDTVARYGGEEFVIILPHTSERGAVAVAEKVRKHIENRITVSGKAQVKVTVSLGISTKTEKQMTMKDMVAFADAALYAAKHQGKDRTVAYSKLTPETNPLIAMPHLKNLDVR